MSAIPWMEKPENDPDYCARCGVFLGCAEFPDGGLVDRSSALPEVCVECADDIDPTSAEPAA